MRKSLIIVLFINILLMISSCSQTAIITGEIDSEPHDAAFQGSSYLMQMDDLKAINLAANFLKDNGESVSFLETFIEYHEADDVAVHLSLANGESVDYLGAYLEVRLYQSDDPKSDPWEECTIIYISQDGKILGHNRIFDTNLSVE